MKKLLLILTKNTTMKRLLLILLCLPMIGFGQSVNKDTIIKNLNEVIDELENELLDCEVELEMIGMEDMNVDCCQAGTEPVDTISYWGNGNKKELGMSMILGGEMYKPLREWYKNGKIKKIYVYGECIDWHELIEIICFNKKGREIICE